MAFKDILKGLAKFGKSKVAKEITEEVTEEGIESITNGLLEKNKELLNSVGNQWKKEAIDTAGALSHLPEMDSISENVLHNVDNAIAEKVNVEPKLEVKNRRKGNREIKEIPVNNSTQQEQQLLLDTPKQEERQLLGSPAQKDEQLLLEASTKKEQQLLEAPVQKEPRKLRREYKSDLGTNTDPIELSGPTKNRRIGNRAAKKPTKQEQQLLLEAPKQKGPRQPRREYKPDLGTNTEPIQLSGPTKNRRRGNKAAKKPAQQEQQLLLEAPKQKELRKPRKEYKADLGTNTEPIELSGPTKNRRKGNRPVKETPVDTSVQQSEQLLLDAPKQKSPRKPSREYRPDLGTNMEAIPLSGPVIKETKTLNFKKGEGTYTNPNKKRISESSKYNTKLIKKYHPTDPTYNLGIKTEGGWIGKEKDYRLPNNDVEPESPIESMPQSKPEQKNKQVDVSLDDFKPADEIDVEDDNEIDVTHLFDEEEPQKTQNISEKENPIDISNVLNDQKESPFNIDDFSMPDIDEIDIEKKLWKDAIKEEQPKESPYRKKNTYDYNLHRESDLYIDPKDRKSIISRRNQGDYNANLTNGFVEDITVNDETYNFKYRKGDKTVVDIYDSNNNIITDKDLYNDILDKGKQERDNFYRSLSDEEWDTVINNAEDYRFSKRVDPLESNKKLLNQNDAITQRQQVLKEKSNNYQTEYENEKKKKKRKEIEKKRNNSEIDILEAEKLKQKNKLKIEARNERQSAREAFQKRVKEEGLEKGTEAYNEALKDLKDAFKNSEKTMEKRLSSSDKILNSQIKGWSGKGLTVKNAITVGFSAKAAVDKYKESRAEGKSAGSAAIRAGASAVAAEVLGPLGSTALMAAQVAPKVAAEGANALYTEYRRMNSASNFVPLGGVNFQDSQELATMRQSGMELAKMAQYNLEQSLMGSEAKHLHR